MAVRLFILISLICGITSETLFDAILDPAVNECGCRWDGDIDLPKIKVHYDNYETRQSATYSIREAASQIIPRTDFQSYQCVHVYITPFIDSELGLAASPFRCMLKKTLCKNGAKPISLIIDHSAYTSGFLPLHYNEYKEAINISTAVGITTGKLIVDILSKIPLKGVILSGHSLGANMVGPAAVYVKNNAGVLDAIYAIDPLGFCIDSCPDSDLNIKSNMANNVIVFHCNQNDLGTSQNSADFDVYVGDGETQNGCRMSYFEDYLKTAVSSGCSHLKCPAIVFDSAINDNYSKAVQCNSYFRYKSGQCQNNPNVKTGYNVVPDGPKGKYYMSSIERTKCDSVIPTRFFEWVEDSPKCFELPSTAGWFY